MAQSEKARMLTSYKDGEQDLMPLCSIPQVIILKYILCRFSNDPCRMEPNLPTERIKAITNFSTIFDFFIIKLFPVLIYNLWRSVKLPSSSSGLMSFFPGEVQAKTALLDLDFESRAWVFQVERQEECIAGKRKKQEQRQEGTNRARHIWGFAITCCGWSPGCMQGMRARKLPIGRFVDWDTRIRYTQLRILWPSEVKRRLFPWCWERLKAGEEGDNRWWDGWMASLTQWTRVWASSKR